MINSRWYVIGPTGDNKTLVTMYSPLKHGFVDFLERELGTKCTEQNSVCKDGTTFVDIMIEGIFDSKYITGLIYMYYPLTIEEVQGLFSLSYDEEKLSHFNLNPRPKGPNAHLVITIDNVNYKVDVALTPE